KLLPRSAGPGVLLSGSPPVTPYLTAVKPVLGKKTLPSGANRLHPVGKTVVTMSAAPVSVSASPLTTRLVFSAAPLSRRRGSSGSQKDGAIARRRPNESFEFRIEKQPRLMVTIRLS